MNILQALALGRERLVASPSPALDARLLLEHSLAVSHSYLLAHDAEELPAAAAVAYQELLERAAQKEPIPYLIGRAPFYGRDFWVTPAALIPRPETEQLVEVAAGWATGRGLVRVVDVGTGSGCIAITLAHLLPAAEIEATDNSVAALAVAQENARRHGVADRIHFHHGHLLDPLEQAPDLVVANLPYIASHEWTALDDGVKSFEPAEALLGGPDGLALIGELMQQAAARLVPTGALCLEIGWRQGPAAAALARAHFPDTMIEVLQDFAGHDRIVAVRRS
jgi:release factor glutamine methyltransferase